MFFFASVVIKLCDCAFVHSIDGDSATEMPISAAPSINDRLIPSTRPSSESDEATKLPSKVPFKTNTSETDRDLSTNLPYCSADDVTPSKVPNDAVSLRKVQSRGQSRSTTALTPDLPRARDTRLKIGSASDVSTELLDLHDAF